MPELPDLTVYLEHLDRRVTGRTLRAIRLGSPFVLRTVEPAIDEVVNREVKGVRRLAKQVVFVLEDGYFIVIHLMISGRLQWHALSGSGPKAVPKRNGLAAFEFDSGTLLFAEASKKKRASIRLIKGAEALNDLDPGGLEVRGASAGEFAERLIQTNHTLNRALTDQRVFAGIGNAYSDEILLRARLSPFKQAAALKEDEVLRLYQACKGVLDEWVVLLRDKAGDAFPTKVTAFHEEMAVHGKYREPCPQCGSPVQRIVYAENEANYCAKCQTGGRLLADRSLSRLLKDNWPKRIEDLE
ncbi:MAG: DNA-formamidopyrimidine glycosylase family protein [Pseudomonadales bacterium]|jgi:formamidopyrimidine-DNA glycosylase|nr:DNA-formamidopyrimidine glycosylase family protein [Pseudomonadales bacterium]MDP6470077.1 DNA-formamidopyrimidine glycosylase family protein [Pseudomonadales bacterium]MDP6826980.1 DNA-formamidopyrimidine glycosylase family protein [Pseudomonadales bacterium]MDP6971075.1 DNA-formamidopyrimidine glycosylase family protein [Pseudomonadales bacterium]|tara:strand:+ start:2783 stop:3679 length:897 start_codon:yes stop_codon:yes gene_type:complete